MGEPTVRAKDDAADMIAAAIGVTDNNRAVVAKSAGAGDRGVRDRHRDRERVRRLAAWRRPRVTDLCRDADARSVSIVVPTLREAANLTRLAERIAGALSEKGIAWELLLVDDDSGDGSTVVVAELAERLPVRMKVRRGVTPDLSRAVLEGIAESRHDRIVVMDADLSHPPERIPDLLAVLDAGCDMVVGSRYVSGASTVGEWGLARALNSRIATLLAAPLAACSDPMAGFFAVDRRALPDPATLRPVGYKVGLELMVRGRLQVREVPIAFDDRRRGKSKLGWRQRLDYLRHLVRLYSHVLAGSLTRRSGARR